MRRSLLLLVAILASASASADVIPKSITDQLRSLQIEQAELSDGALRVRFKKSVVNKDAYFTLVRSTCMPICLAEKKDGWGSANIERVEAINQVGAQGFAFVGGRRSCAELGKVVGDDSKFIDSKTFVCVARNPCRERRPGELTSGD